MPNPLHYQGQYASFMAKKPPYVHQDYPKAVKLKNNREIVAQTQADELRIIAEDNTDKTALHPAEARAEELAIELNDVKTVAAQAEAEKASLQAQLDEMKAQIARLTPNEALPELDKLLKN